MPKLPELISGDALIYYPHSLFGLLIKLKTWSDASHIEIYCGNGECLASRDGKGVGVYPLRMTEIGYILRPKTPVTLNYKWFYEKADGQKYDWLGILCFTLAVKQGAPDRMFCSEFAKRQYEMSDYQAIQKNWDADHTEPAAFLKSPMFDWIYVAPHLWRDGYNIVGVHE